MVKVGKNKVRGVPVHVRLCPGHKRICARVLEDGSIRMSVPKLWANMTVATNYLNLCWDDLMAKRAALHRRIAEDAPHVVAVLAVVFGSRFLAGCATVNVWHEGDRTICEVSDSAWYLFDRRPIGSGDVNRPNERAWVCGRDTVSHDNNMKLVAWAMEREGADTLGPTEQKWHKTDIVPLALQRYTLHTYAELKYGSGRRSGHPAPDHDCIGARERRVFK